MLFNVKVTSVTSVPFYSVTAIFIYKSISWSFSHSRCPPVSADNFENTLEKCKASSSF